MPPYSFALPSTVTSALVRSTHLPPLICTEPLASYDKLLTRMVRVFADAPSDTDSVVLMTFRLRALITSSGMTTTPEFEAAATAVCRDAGVFAAGVLLLMLATPTTLLWLTIVDASVARVDLAALAESSAALAQLSLFAVPALAMSLIFK